MKAPRQLRRILRSPKRHSILTPGRNCWRLDQATNSGLLIDGRDYYQAFYHAAKTADHYLLISGWQFTSNVALLRGADAQGADGALGFLEFLNQLCERKSGLHIYLLAWDYSMIYSLDREWFQDWIFNGKTNERLRFCYDRADAFDASHHQKFVVVDGSLGFVGGLDLCASRWDERDHRADNALRVDSDGKSYRTFHDLQTYHTGPLVGQLAELFQQRWQTVCGDCLVLPVPERTPNSLPFQASIDIGPATVAISRTEVKANNHDKPILEIRQLFIDAIDAAEQLIYIENQYCSSEAIGKALIERMKQRRRPRLQIVLIIAKAAEAFLEQLSIDIAQSRIIRSLRETAADTGHALGIYYPASADAEGAEVDTYIHSKLLLVDDRFLSVGSANINNRSMGYDTELNVAWDDVPGSALSAKIRSVRVDLLAEHTGLHGTEREPLAAVAELVNYLNALADSAKSRLRHHPTRSLAEEYQWLATFLPDGLPFDSEIAVEGKEQPSKQTSFIANWFAHLAHFFRPLRSGPPKPDGAAEPTP